MPQVAVAVAGFVGSTVAAVLGGGAVATAAGAAIANGIAALGFAQGIGAAVSAWATVGALASTVGARKPKVGISDAGGTQVDFQADPNAGVPLVLGRTGTRGVAVHQTTDGPANKNAHLLWLIVLSAGPIQQMHAFRAGSEDLVLTAGGELHGGGAVTAGKYADHMAFRVQLGAHPEGPFQPVSVAPGAVEEWTDAHRLSGLAAVWWALEFDQEIYASGTPSPMFEVEGPAAYDARLDSSYPGGIGAHVWTDQSSWSFGGKSNPYLQALSWCAGRFANGKRTHGPGLPVAAVDRSAFVEGANVAEANAWTIGGVVMSTDRKWDVLGAMLQAGGGRATRLGGQVSCVVNAPRVSLATITGADLVGEVSITGSRSRRERFNRVIPRYRSEAHNWEIVPADPVTVATYVTEDGGERTKEIEYPLVQDVNQVAQLAAYDIVNSREFGPIILPLKPKFLGYKAGDCLTVNEPELGLNNQKVLVLKREFDPATGVVTLTCQSETDAKHDFALGRTGVAPPTPGLSGVDPSEVPVPGVEAWTAVGTSLAGPDGSLMPAIVITGQTDDPRVQNVIAEWRLKLGPGSYGDWVSSEHPRTVRRIEARALLPETTYHVRIRYRTVRQVESELFRDLGEVITGPMMVSAGVTEIGGLTPAELVARLEGVIEQGRLLSQAVLSQFTSLVADRADMVTLVHHNGQTVKAIVLDEIEQRQEGDSTILSRIDLIGLVNEAGNAFQLAETTLMVSPEMTFAQYKESLQANFETTNAAITTEQTARSAADTALASLLTTVSTTVGGHTASITSLAESVDGLEAQYVLAVSAGNRVAGMRLAAGGGVSSIAFSADQIGFTNGTSDIYPFAIVGGEVRATNLRVDRVTAGSIVADSIVGGAVTSTSVSAAGGASMGATIVSHPHASLGGVHVVIASVIVFQTGSGVSGVEAILYRNGSEIDRGSIAFAGPFSSTIPLLALDQPGVGTATYTIVCNTTGGSTATNGVAASKVVITELKK